jgi:hypothetical protein
VVAAVEEELVAVVLVELVAVVLVVDKLMVLMVQLTQAVEVVVDMEALALKEVVEMVVLE